MVITEVLSLVCRIAYGLDQRSQVLVLRHFKALYPQLNRRFGKVKMIDVLLQNSGVVVILWSPRSRMRDLLRFTLSLRSQVERVIK